MQMALEGLGVAANVFAVVDLSVKVIAWCARYAQDVSHAKEDKTRLSQEVTRLNLASANARDILHGPHGSRLKASHALYLATADGQSQLRRIENLLASGQAQNKASFESLKWPFRSKDVELIVQDLRRCIKAICSALEVDQTSIMLDIDHRTALDRLPEANGASFDSHAEEHNPTCLPNTRVELLDDVSHWVDNPDSKTIFWLNGMAGTGKSTISRTVARSRSLRGDLGASFFFKRGETDRGNLDKFVPTLARQLASSIPGTASHIKNAIEADPAVIGKAVSEQFDKLLQDPLSKIAQTSTRPSSVVIVIDALDECERDADIRLLIKLFSRVRSFRRPRIFLTSRPELPIRLGFAGIKGIYQDLVLHDIPQSTIEHDICAFLRHELFKIREDFNSMSEEHKLPTYWPGESNLRSLVMAAVPLFIAASTICRFINDWASDNPQERLQRVLSHMKDSHASQFAMTYSPILEQQVVNKPEDEREEIIGTFHLIIGTVITLASPLSTRGLASMLDIPVNKVAARLRMLHSVLNVPSSFDSPVRPLHLSFRDYLVDPKYKETNNFSVDEKLVHRNLARQCLRIMGCGLRENIYGLSFPGIHESAIPSQRIRECLPSDLQYACLYWVHHQTAVDFEPDCIHEIYDFLMKHFLCWLEMMSLMSWVRKSLALLKSLANWLEDGNSSSLSSFLADAIQFLDRNLSVINETPLQIYSSALASAPSKSIIRESFKDRIPKWLSLWSPVDDGWDSCVSTLAAHSDRIASVVLSHDTKIAASASYDHTVRIWNAQTGKCEQVLQGHNSRVVLVVFSHDSKVVASASEDKTVRTWNVKTGKCEQVLQGHSGFIVSLVLSHDSKVAASASYDKSVRTWDLQTGKCEQVLQGHSDRIASVVFSHDSEVVASASYDKTVRIWNVKTGKCEQVLQGHGDWVYLVAFSHDAKIVASVSWDETVRIWNVKGGTCEQVVPFRSWTRSLSFTVDNAGLITEAGVVTVTDEPAVLTGSAITSQPPTALTISLRNDTSWISLGGKDLLRLPAECHHGLATVSGHTIAVGCESGTVSFFGFSPIEMAKLRTPTGY